MKIISGGQTGAEQAGWRAAKAYGIKTGGWMPKRFMTERGPYPSAEVLYGAAERLNDCYVDHTKRNIWDSKASLIFDWNGNLDFLGAKGALAELHATGKRYAVISPNVRFWPPACADWLMNNNLCKRSSVINITGDRESKAPGIGRWVEQYLREMFWLLGYRPVNPNDNI
jgi:Circularly permutated YpsA SLOG family